MSKHLARECAPQLVQGGTCGCTGELRVLGESHSAFDSVPVHLAEGIVTGGTGVAEGHVEAVWCGIRTESVQPFDHALPLLGRPVKDRGPTADTAVQLLNVRRASPRYERAQHILHRQLDYLAVTEDPRPPRSWGHLGSSSLCQF